MTIWLKGVKKFVNNNLAERCLEIRERNIWLKGVKKFVRGTFD